MLAVSLVKAENKLSSLRAQHLTDFDINQQPVIGVLSQQLDVDFLDDPRFSGYDSYIMTAYVKFLEASGARVVPLILGEPEEVTMDKLSKLNGVLFPGGDGDYTDYGLKIINKLMEYNDQGLVYPAWGTCLGYETMMIWASSVGTKDIWDSYIVHDISLPLKFVVDPTKTAMFGDLGKDSYLFEKEGMTLNSHNWGVDPQKFVTDEGLASSYKLTSISFEPEGEKRPFAASVEHLKYPFFGTQFHPEKTMTMFNDDSGVNHTWSSIKLNRYFGDKFVTLARQNTNTYGDFATVQTAIVANYDLIVTDYWAGEVYVFKQPYETEQSFLN